MAYYYSIRGWLEVFSMNDFLKLTTIISSFKQRYEKHNHFELYIKGWCWINEPINWTKYVFYGADVMKDGIDLFNEIINELNINIHELVGNFHVEGEDGEHASLITIKDGVINHKPTHSITIDG